MLKNTCDSFHLKGALADSRKHIANGSKVVKYHVCFNLLNLRSSLKIECVPTGIMGRPMTWEWEGNVIPLNLDYKMTFL